MTAYFITFAHSASASLAKRECPCLLDTDRLLRLQCDRNLHSEIFTSTSRAVTPNQNQFMIGFRSNFSPKYSLFGFYRLGFSKGDTDGVGTFPAYTYDLTGEYGRSSGDIRHNFVVGGNLTLPWHITANPFITVFSGRPFNITLGNDPNGDLLFTERPTFGQLATHCNEIGLTASYCNIGSNDPNAIIPRNFGQAPGFFSVNMRLGRTFGFGGSDTGGTTADNQGARGGNRGSGGGRGGRGGGGGRGAAAIAGGGGGMMGGFGGGTTSKPYNLNVGVQFTNIFNNVNYNSPVGVLNSSRFGQSTGIIAGFGGFGGGGGGGSAANPRRIELQLRFSW